jgi:RNA polymerase sigma factor (sigma-70 family)
LKGLSIDRAIWDSLVQQINRCIRRKVDAEDLLQTAYLRFMSYPRRALVDNVQAFLVRTAINIDVDNYRRERFFAGLTTEVRNGSDTPPLQDEILAARTSLKRVEAGLSQLNPRTREILLMHRLENMKYRDIAKQLEISESAVEKHIAKGTLFLGKWMEGW